MSNRREFLQMSLAASAMPAIAADSIETAAPSSNTGAQRRQRMDLIVEMTSPFALAFRDETVRLGFEPHGIKDDITDLWYHTLDLRWKRVPATLAGITLSTSLFCLETLARDYGMRVQFRAVHSYLPTGQVEHALSGADSVVRQAAAFEGQWSVGFARMAASLTVLDATQCQMTIVESAAARTQEPGPMVSWIIAPRPKSHPGLIS